ncbi:MAG: NAD(+)/NADH kinase [Clostridiales bacterium]|nr:NAD(+)/NADH kinase [Clostridiales bacterium]
MNMKNIAVLANTTKEKSIATAERIADFLVGKACLYTTDDCRISDKYDVTYMSQNEIYNAVDIAIVIGGDGTLLRYATPCAKAKVPVLGINLGTVGFLTEVELDDIETSLTALLCDEYIKEERMLLKACINDNETYHALNDIVVAKRDHEQLIHVDLYAGGELVYHYKADGLIIATPTGSTGYSISAGGPVVDPKMDLYVATPICAHMLLARSTVLPADKELVIRLCKNDAIISADGEFNRSLTNEDVIRISKSNYKFELIKIGKTSFYNTLINKLS